jgi:hypothetical protein
MPPKCAPVQWSARHSARYFPALEGCPRSATHHRHSIARPPPLQVRLDRVRHAPGGLVGDGHLPLDLARRHPFVPRSVEEHHIEPILQRRPRPRKRRPRFRVNVIGAPLANISLALPKPMKPPHPSALRTRPRIAEPDRKQMIKTRILRRKPLRKDAVKNGFGIARRHAGNAARNEEISVLNAAG